jgi:hypothetical protein
MRSTAISNYFGSDSTGGGIGFQFRTIKKDADRQRACFDSGGDPKDLGIGGPQAKGQILKTFFHSTARFLWLFKINHLLTGNLEMAKFIGSDCTRGALEWQFRRYRAGAKLQILAVEAGQDPKNINVDVNPQGKPDGKAYGGTNCTFFFSLPAQHSICSLWIDSY